MLEEYVRDANAVLLVGAASAAILLSKWWLSSSSSSRSSKQMSQHPWPKVPGALPFVGNFLKVGGLDNLQDKVHEWADKYGKEKGVFEMSLAGVRYVVPCREDTVLEIFARRPFRVRRSKNITRAANGLGAEGLFSAEGDDWKKDRRVVAPLLNKRHVSDYLKSIKIVASRLLAKWEGIAADGSAVVINDDCYHYAIDIIALATFGTDFDSLRRDDSVHARDVAFLLNRGMIRSLSPVAYWNIPLIGQYLDGCGFSRNRLLTYIEDMIKDCEESPSKEQKDTFLGKLVAVSREQSSRLSRRRMIGNVITQFFGGTDSTAASLSTMLWLIATNENGIQSELAAEAVGLGNLDTATLEDLSTKLPRLKAFSYEVYRCYSPFPFVFLQAAEEVMLCGEKIPRRTEMMVPVNYINTSKTNPPKALPLGPNEEYPPNDFCPRRWLVEGKNGSLSVMTPDVNGGSFLPFGHGPRICPGRDLTETVSMVALVALLQKYELSLEQNHPPVRRILRFSMEFDKDVCLVLTPRK